MPGREMEGDGVGNNDDADLSEENSIDMYQFVLTMMDGFPREKTWQFYRSLQHKFTRFLMIFKEKLL